MPSLTSISSHHLVEPARAEVRVNQGHDGSGDEELPLDARPDVLGFVPSRLGEGKGRGDAGQAGPPQQEGEAEMAQGGAHLPPCAAPA
eukprot:7372608-Pyramimonas_sp.AAC.1